MREPIGCRPLPEAFALVATGRVCIVTNEFHGLFKNGGIGTANTGLALALAEAGFSVTVTFSSWSGLPAHEFRQLRDDYRKIGIELELITETPAFPKPFDSPQSASYAVYLYLRERAFDAVYFHENCGRGFYSLLAKHTGVFPNAPKMFVVCHGPHEWVYEINAVRYHGTEPIAYAYLERRSVELADAIISPSQYLVDWMAGHGWKLPAHVFVEQNVIRVAERNLPAADDTPLPVKELVFFGRTEMRKGLVLFCDAIDRLENDIDLSEIRVTFLGKFSQIEGMNSGIYLLERSRRWSCPVRFLAKLDQTQALDYLSRPDVLAVIPSLAENSPCVVAECLQLGIPFVATDSGGTAELIAPRYRGNCLTAADPATLATRLTEALRTGQAPARLAVSQAETIEHWAKFLKIGTAAQPKEDAVIGVPLVSICLVNTGASDVGPALESALSQTYPNIEVVLADATGGAPFAAANPPRTSLCDEPPFRAIACAGLRPAGARNLAASKAVGACFLFLDESVTLEPDCVAVLVDAARRASASVVTGLALPADRNTTSARNNDDGVPYLPLGACLEIGIVENCFGDSVALVGRGAFDAIGGFPAINDHISGFWQFFATAAVAGEPVEVVPIPLYRTAERKPPVLSTSDFLRSGRAIHEIYGRKPVATLAKLLEGFIDVDRGQQQRLDGLVADLDQGAREFVARISRLEPNSPEALEGFLRYGIERGKAQEALEFAFYNGIAGGAIVRWVKKETTVQFEWTSPRNWEIELQLGRLINADQIRRISAYVGDRELPVSATTADGSKTTLLITGIRGSLKSSLVSVRIQLPSVHRASDPTADFGLAIDRMAIRSADEAHMEADGARAGRAEEIAAVSSKPAETQASALPAIAIGGGDDRTTAGSVQLDDYFATEGYRHLDLSIRPAAVGVEDWAAVKFKFCRSGTDHHLEFREAPGWPMMFIEFPSVDQDDYGLLMRFSRKHVAGVAKWAFDRDKLLMGAILTLLPAAVALALDQSKLQAAERAEWVSEARKFSESFLRDLRQSGALRPATSNAEAAAAVSPI